MSQNSHPLEKVFDLNPATFVEPESVQISQREHALTDPTSGEIIKRSSEPDLSALEKEERIEDLHIDGQLETIHNAAMTAYEKQARMTDEVDPKFGARMGEVAAQFLNIALNSVNSRVDAKYKRQKVRIAKADAGTPKTLNQNVIVADRNAVLRALLANKDQGGEIIDEVK